MFYISDCCFLLFHRFLQSKEMLFSQYGYTSICITASKLKLEDVVDYLSKKRIGSLICPPRAVSKTAMQLTCNYSLDYLFNDSGCIALLPCQPIIALLTIYSKTLVSLFSCLVAPHKRVLESLHQIFHLVA